VKLKNWKSYVLECYEVGFGHCWRDQEDDDKISDICGRF